MSLLQIFSVLSIFFLLKSEVYGETKDKVFCQKKEKNATLYKSDGAMVSIVKEIVECNFYYNVGFPYNLIGQQLLDVYDFSDYLNQERIIYVYHPSVKKVFEICFIYGDWQLMPSGLDLIFPNLNSLNITHGGLLILDKVDMRQFGENLYAANFSNNLLTFLSDELFKYNENLEHCDFSSNPLLHIPDDFLISPALLLEDVYCLKYSKLNSSSCKNPESVILYADLEYHLKKQHENIELKCFVGYNCDTEIWDDIRKTEETIIYSCNMTVENSRTKVSGEMLNLTIYKPYIKCNATKIETSFMLHNNFIRYIPEKISDVIKHEITSIEIVHSGLISISEFNMKQFGNKLSLALFTKNKIEAIGRNTFKHNNNLMQVDLKENPILFVDSKYVLRPKPNILTNKIFRGYRCGEVM